MTAADLIVQGGIVVTSGGRRALDLAIRQGVFVAIVPAGQIERSTSDGARTIDAAGRFVLPGVIDGHVHFREPGMEDREDWATGSLAAVHGGVTTVIDMPNTIPPTATADLARAKLDLAGSKSSCDFALIGLLSPDQLDELEAMAGDGLVVGFKAFLGPTTGDIDPPDDELLAEGMTRIARLGMRLGLHAEDAGLIERTTAELRATGRSDALAHVEARPIEAEVLAIERAAAMAKQTGCAIHVFHLTSMDGLRAIERWREQGVDITSELSPHHAFLTSTDAARVGVASRVNPPLRDAGHGAGLLAALTAGRIDAIATDHAPHRPKDKAGTDIWSVAAGFAGVETSLRLFMTLGVHAGLLSWEQLVRATSEGPARTWGLWPAKGAIAVGSDADLVIVDPEREDVIDAAALHPAGRPTPFQGVRTVGAPVMTIVRGQVVMDEGQVVGTAGWGRRVARLARAA